MAEIVALTDAIDELVHDGDTVALEGFTHLIPFAAGHELIRQGRRDLTLVRMTPDLVYDQLIGAGLRAQARVLVGRQSRRRLAAPLPRRRRARLARARSRSRSTRTRAWRPPTRRAPRGLPFARAARLRGHRPAQAHTVASRRSRARSPASGSPPCRALRPDVGDRPCAAGRPRGQRAALGHHRRPEGGGARARAIASSPSRRSCDELVPRPGAVVLPSWVVTAVAEAPGGAHPSYAHGYYERDNAFYVAGTRSRATASVHRLDPTARARRPRTSTGTRAVERCGHA